MIQNKILTFQEVQLPSLLSNQFQFNVYSFWFDTCLRQYYTISQLITKSVHQIINLPMAVQGFKNLIKTSLFTDDSFQPLLKKSDQYRKITQVALLHFQLIVKNFETFEQNYQRLIVDYQQDIEVNEINVPQYYQKYLQLYRNIWSEQKSFSDKLSNNLRQLSALCDSLFTNFSNTILNFQGYIRGYKAHEQVLIQLSKKYFRTHKSMISNIQFYKETFTDVKIIYNIDEKNKRYNNCQGNLKNLQEELEIIEDKVGQLSAEKQQIIQSYIEIEKQFTLTLKAVGSKLIAISRSFVFDFCQMEKIIITYLAEKKFTLEKIELKTFFTSQTKLNFEQYFNVQIDPSKLEFYPIFVVYHKNIKEQYYSQLGKMFTAISRENDEKIQHRKKLNKRILQFTANFMKTYEKAYYFSLKEIIANFQKVKKRISQVFGSKLCSFLKSIHSIFQLSIGINQKLLKRLIVKIKSIELYVNEQIKILDLFQKQFKSNIEKFVKKKQLKRLLSTQKDLTEYTEQQPSLVQIGVIKSEISQKSEYISILIDGFVQKLKKNYDQLKFQYNAIVNDISVSTNEFYSLCCEYQQLYFGEEQFLKNYKKYENDIDATLLNQCKFFQQINFGSLLKDDRGKIVFDSQMGNIQQFKKLKKPIQIQVQKNKKTVDPPSDIKNKEFSQEEQTQVDGEAKTQQSKGQKNQNQNKYRDFIYSKITFLNDQKFFKSFSCALSDKILLTGRLYITNKRLCFHSKFNPSNVFFGDTFIQIPKQDIKKVEKRFNAIVFDNSISITTVNGEVFLTSFFSRNQAFDLICQALQIDIDECMFEPQEIKESIVEQVLQVPQQDDLKPSQQAERVENIQKLLANFPYKQLLKTQFAYPGFTAFKYLKQFELGTEIVFNRKTYKNFAIYLKQCYEHKQYQFSQWSPSPVIDFLNPADIKDTTPLSFTRKITCIVPIPNSGVPFMPKTAKSEENQTLFIISKDKFILQSTIQNSGVPYSDTFNLKVQKMVETLNQNCCRLTVSFHVNFTSNTFMKGVIQSKSTQQFKTALAKLQTQAKKYLTNLERNRLKDTKCLANGQNKNEAINNNNEQYQKEIAELKQSQININNLLKISNIKLEQGKKILIGSLILNVLLILILLT